MSRVAGEAPLNQRFMDFRVSLQEIAQALVAPEAQLIFLPQEQMVLVGLMGGMTGEAIPGFHGRMWKGNRMPLMALGAQLSRAASKKEALVAAAVGIVAG